MRKIMNNTNLQNLFSLNLKQLSVYSEDTFKDNSIDKKLILRKTKTLLPTALYNDKLLHSSYDPTIEYTNISKNITKKKFDCIIVFEMGLGYVVEKLYEEYPNIPIIIIQMNLELSINILSTIDFTINNAIIDSAIFIKPTPQTIIDYLYYNNYCSPLVLNTQAAKHIYDNNELSKMENTIHEYAIKAMINKNTLAKFKYRWSVNIIKNLTNISIKLYSISTLANIYKNYPILLCAAGSSIEEMIPHLGQLRKRMPIICVDTALSTLHELEIIPDFIVSVDPQFINSKHLNWHIKWAIEKGSSFIIDITTSSRSIDLLPLNTSVFTFKSPFVLVQKLCEGVGITQEICSGGSVSTVAWEICRILGSTNIYTTGLDLSFVNKRSHCKGTHFEKNAIIENSRLNTLENNIFKRVHNTPHRNIVQSHNEKTLISNIQFEIYNKWFEQQTTKHGHINCYSVSENSAKIKGYKTCSINSLMKLPNTRTKINQININMNKNNKAVNHNLIIKNVIHIVEDLIETQSIIRNMYQKIYSITLQSNIDKINKILYESACMSIIQFSNREDVPKHINIKLLPKQTEQQIQYLSKLYCDIYTHLETIINIFEKHCTYVQHSNTIEKQDSKKISSQKTLVLN